MNRRIRYVCRSGRRDEPSSSFHRFLKPGALAQLRDSRISARFQRPSSLTQIFLCRSSSPLMASLSSSSNATNVVRSPISMIDGGFPCFTARSFGPSCPQRKKLVAAKSFFFLNSSPSSPVSDSSLPDPVVDLFGPPAAVDVIVSH